MSWIFPLLCLVFMVAMVFMCLGRGGGCAQRRYSDGASPYGSRETPRQALDRRYARGEITREQYLDLKRTLNPSGEQS